MKLLEDNYNLYQCSFKVYSIVLIAVYRIKKILQIVFSNYYLTMKPACPLSMKQLCYQQDVDMALE